MKDSDHEDHLDALVFQYLERVEAGETAVAVLSELCDKHPEEARALERGVSLLRDVRLHPGPAADGLPERVGPFRLLRRLGAGGMGVVYLAAQENPTREVALKLVRPDQLWFEGYRERFTREIESAARLAHPSIAPVYEMGEHDGVPWFSQEYVIGAPLSELLANVPAHSPQTLTGADLRSAMEAVMDEDAPASAWDEEFFRGTWVDVCLRIARQIADALQHAHERGVLHRDVKPSNILLTPGGRAVLVDFGLASLQGTERLTRSGAQLGSLHYMPPEQLDGRVRDIGPRSDVYSLGVTLYELLTLRAPYASQSVQRLRGLILEGHAPEPRRSNRAISRDVNVVVTCAMDPAIERRYETASEFAADLVAARAHRPIAARPAGLGLRMARWIHRHPTAATGIAAGFLIFMVAPTVFGVQSYLAAERQRDLNDELSSTLGQRDALLAATLDGFEDVIRWTAHDALSDVPGVQEERLEVIDKGLAIFSRVRDLRPEDSPVRLQQALMLRTRGNILSVLGREAEAHAQFEEAAVAFEQALEDPDAGTVWLRQLASLRYQQALIQGRLGHGALALSLGRAALEHQRRATELDPHDARNHKDLSAYAGLVANGIHRVHGPTAEATALIQEAISAAGRAGTMDPDDPHPGRSLYEALSTRAEWRETEGRQRESLSDHEQAIASLERALALDPENRVMRGQYVHALSNRAKLRLDISRNATAAVSELERALELCDGLITDYPSVPDHLRERLLILDSLANAYRKSEDFVRARETQEQAVEGLIALVRQTPEDLKASIDAGMACYNLTNAYFFDEALGEARLERVLELCDQAQALAAPFARENPGSRYELQLRMMLHYKRGAVYNQLERADELRAEVDQLRALELDVPVKYLLTGKLLLHWANRAAEESGRVEALAELELAVAKGFEDLATWEQGEFELELAQYPRIVELAALVRERAEGR